MREGARGYGGVVVTSLRIHLEFPSSGLGAAKWLALAERFGLDCEVWSPTELVAYVKGEDGDSLADAVLRHAGKECAKDLTDEDLLRVFESRMSPEARALCDDAKDATDADLDRELRNMEIDR